MSENEALDVDSRHARGWKFILELALAGDPVEKTNLRPRRARTDLINSAIESFANCGLLMVHFLEQRHSQRQLKKHVARCLDQSFAELLNSVLIDNPNATNTECVYQWEQALLDRASTPIRQGISHASA
jgi:hypothetical protein